MLPETCAPDGLTDDVPRAARFTTSTQVSRLSLLLFIVSVACLLGWLHDRDLGRMKALKAQGRAALARVVGKHTTQGKSTSYFLEYDFRVNRGWQYGERSVSEDEYAGSRPGDAAVVTYLPSQPETFVFGAMTPARIQERQGVWLWGEGAAFAFLSVWAFGMEATFRRHLSLLRDGTATQGVITDRNARPPQGPPQVTYQFVADGRTYSEKISTSFRFYEQAEPGSTLTVLYDPARPSHSIPDRALTNVTLSDRR